MSFADAVYEAVRIRNRHDSRAAVHDLVAAELRKLDSGVRVTATDYFNHSFVPDLSLSWDGQDATRDVFLRMSVSSAAFGEDLHALEARGALFLGVFDREPIRTAPWAVESPPVSLVTQAQAVDEFDDAVEQDARAVGATKEIVRRGRGTIDAPHASEIGSTFRSALRSMDELGSVGSAERDASAAVSSFLEHARVVLPEEGSLEMEQSLHAHWIRSGGAPSAFPGQMGWDPTTIDPSALRAILLDLIASKEGVSPQTWADLAGHLLAEDVGGLISQPVYDGGFDQMAAALSPGWMVRWVWATEAPSLGMLPSPYAWLIEGDILGIELGSIRLFFAHDGRRFTQKPGGSSLPTLNSMVRVLDRPEVHGVELQSPTAEMTYLRRDARDSLAKMLSRELVDLDQAGQRVTGMTVTVPDSDHLARVDFGERKIDFGGVPTRIQTAARLAVRYFGDFEDADMASLDRFLDSSGGASWQRP